MPMLTGLEATLLSYLAEYPNAPDQEEVLDRLGPEAKKIGHVIIGKITVEKKYITYAEAIKLWAK